MQRQSVLIMALLGVTILPARAADDKNTVGSTLQSATVYRNGAELIHKATATLHQGNNELVIDDISNTIDPSSIQVSCPGNVTIMSVAFSKEYLKGETTTPLVKMLTDSITTIKRELSQMEVLVKADNELLDLLGANKSITGQNGVTLAELSKMVDYYKQKITALRTELYGYQEKETKWRQTIEKLESQLREEERRNSKSSGRLILQLLSPQDGRYDLTISYLTPAAYWNPFYDLKVNNSKDPLRILYKAKLVQTSGIDWKNVKLSLSTSVPMQHSNAPLLKTWFLKFIDPMAIRYENNAKSNSFSSALQGHTPGIQIRGTNSLSEVVVTSAAPGDREESSRNMDPLIIVNGQQVSEEEFKKIDPRAIKQVEVLKGAEAAAIYGSRASAGAKIITLKDELGDYISVRDGEMDVTFDIDLPYDVPGNGKEQGVELKEYKMPCNFQYYAAPAMDKEAYLLGQVPGWEKLNLLPGEANIIVEGTYIGRSNIEPNSTQDTLNLTLGRDKRVVVKREKVVDFSSVKFLGNNKKQIFTYEITVRNNKKENIRLLLKDQYPISSNKDIEEELLESSGAAVNKETGILTWNTALAAGETRKYRISYSIKYPKDKVLNVN